MIRKSEENHLQPQDNVDWESLAIWDAEEDHCQSKELVQKVKKFQASFSVSFEDKCKSCQRFLNEYEEKKGVMVQIPWGQEKHNLGQQLGVPGGNEFVGEPGADPWLIAEQPNCWRFGPSAFPLPGFACMLSLAAFSPPMSLIAIPLLDIVQAGLVTLSDLPNFLETAPGAELVKKIGTVINMTHSGQCVYVPYGYWIIPIGRDSNLESKDDAPPTYMWHFPMFIKSAFKKINNRVWQPLKLLNFEHLRKLSGQEVWKQRLTLLEKVSSDKAWELLNPDLVANTTS